MKEPSMQNDSWSRRPTLARKTTATLALVAAVCSCSSGAEPDAQKGDDQNVAVASPNLKCPPSPDEQVQKLAAAYVGGQMQLQNSALMFPFSSPAIDKHYRRAMTPAEGKEPGEGSFVD